MTAKKHVNSAYDINKIIISHITEELLQWKSSGSGSRKPRLTAVGTRCADHATPSVRKSCNFADMLRSLGPYNPLVD
jgi:hypothetical protein